MNNKNSKIYLSFQDLYLIREILEDLEEKDNKELRLLDKLGVIIRRMQKLHADKDRAKKLNGIH